MPASIRPLSGLTLSFAIAAAGCCPNALPGGGTTLPGVGGGQTGGGPTSPTVSAYDLTAAIPLSGLLSGEMVLGVAFDEATNRLYLCGSGALLYTLDLVSNPTTLSVVRLGRSNKVSHPYGMTFTTNASTLAILDYNSGSGAGRARVVRLSKGADGTFTTPDDTAPTPTVLPGDLDLATGITFDRRTNEFIFVTTRTINGGVEELIVMDDRLQRIVRRFRLSSIGIRNPQDVAYSAGRVVILSADGALNAVDPANGALLDQAQDPAAQLASSTAVQGHLSYATGLAFGFRQPDLTETPLFITNKPANRTRGTDKLLVLDAR